MVAGPDGNVWVTSPDDTIERITPTGSVTDFHGPEIDHPGAIAAGSDGALWFVDDGDDAIGRITTEGKLSETSSPSIRSSLADRGVLLLIPCARGTESARERRIAARSMDRVGRVRTRAMRRMLAADTIQDVLEPYLGLPRQPTAEDRPWVLANMVGGLDGSAAMGGRVGDLSTGTDAELFRLLRSLADVVLVGAETVRRERYGPVRLPAEHQARRRNSGCGPVPRLAVVTRSLDLDWTAPMFSERAPGSRPMVITTTNADLGRLERAANVAEVLFAGPERVDLRAALRTLRARGARTILCEGGPRLLGELVDGQLLDELCLTLSPMMGGDPLPVAVTPNGSEPRAFRLCDVLEDEHALFLHYLLEGRQR